jgi:glycosyltransferase involved in cell wall biosynthesis
MKVLVLHSELGVLRGGGENFTRNLFQVFAERGHGVMAAFVADYSKRYSFSPPRGIEPFPIPGWWSRNFGQATLSAIGRVFSEGSQLRKKWDYLQEAVSWRIIRWHNCRFRRRVERIFSNRWSEFDAIYVHGDALLASNVARHRPTVLRLPGPVTAEFTAELRAAHAVCANGDALAKVRTFLGDHVVDLPVGLNEKLFRPGPTIIRSKLGWSEQDQVVGYVGRLNHLKGVDLLSAGFREVSKTLSSARLLIIGSGEEEKNIRSDLANEFSRRIVHIEQDVDHEQLPEWYRAMDIMVMPSRYENFSNALLEGMACGVSFLAADVGGNKILAGTGAGWLFEPESVSALAAGLQRSLQHPSELKRRGEAGVQYVQKFHSWSNTALRLEEILSSRLGVQN